jgi:phage terminase large subunit-like protein
VKKFHDSKDLIRVLAGPNRGGKTTAGSYELLCFATGYNPIRKEKYEVPNIVWAISLDYGNLGHVMREKVMSLLPPGYKFYKQENIVTLPNKSEIHFKSADAGREKFQGAGIMAAWFDEEPKGLAGSEIFSEVYARRKPGWPLKIFMTFTPLQGLSWAYRDLWNEQTRRYPSISTFSFQLDDCSTSLGGFLSDDEIETIKAGYTEWEREARVYGRWGQVSGRPYFSPKQIEEARQRSDKPVYGSVKKNAISGYSFTTDDAGNVAQFRPPRSGGDYIVGVDVGGGGGRDYTVATVWDRRDLAEVAVWRSNTHDPEQFAREHLVPLASYYNYALVVPETNGEHGGTCISVLKNFAYPNIYMYQEWNKVRNVYMDNWGWRTTVGTRGRIFDSIAQALREGKFTPSSLLCDELSMISVDEENRPDHLDGCHDDHVIATGIALTVNAENPPPKKIPYDKVTYASPHAEHEWMGV